MRAGRSIGIDNKWVGRRYIPPGITPACCMLPPWPRRPLVRSSAFFLLCAAGGLVPSYSQDFTLRVSDGDRVLDDSLLPTEALGGMKGGFYLGTDGSVTYDSNFFITDDYTTSELTTVVAPWVVYRTDPEGGAEFSFDARYSPAFRTYLENSDLAAVDQSGRISLRYEGAKTRISVHAGYAEVSMSDRIAGGFIQGSILDYGINGSYQLAPRTSLLASWAASKSDYDTGGRSGADVYTSEIAGLWDATERLRFGPALRYALTESDSTGERDAISVLLKTRYQWGEKVMLAASGGVEFSKNSRQGGGRQAGLTGSFSADYRLSDRWTLRSALRYATVPSPNDLNLLVNDLSLTAGIVRHFGSSSLEFGFGIGSSEYEAVGAIATGRLDDEYLSTQLTYRRELFAERASFDTSLRCSTNDGQQEWSQWQLSTGLSVEF